MKTAKIYLLIAFGLLLFVFALCAIDSAQDSHPTTLENKPPKVDSPKLDAKEAPQEVQMKILKAKIALKDAKSELDGLQIQWASNKQQYDNAQQAIQQKFAPAQQTLELKQSILDSEEEAACKALGLEKGKYKFDEDKMTCSPLAEPAPATPSPAKK